MFLTLHSIRNKWFTNSFINDKKNLQLSTDNKKLFFFVTKRLHLVTAHPSKEQGNQDIGVLKAGSTVNDIVHHFDCSRQTIHDLMNRYTSTGSVRVRARPARARVTTLRPYRVNTLTHLHNRFCSAFMHKKSLIIFCKIRGLAFSSMAMQGLTHRVNNHTSRK